MILRDLRLTHLTVDEDDGLPEDEGSIPGD
jgi:hypothetical protein